MNNHSIKAQFVGAGSVTWKINREALVLLAGPRALLLQIAHPGVAAGVYHHSDWQSRPWRRLWNTLWLMSQVTFSPPHIAAKALRKINRAHRSVAGNIGIENFERPMSYSARDPELAWWVLATLIDGSIYAYERWIAPLQDSDSDAYYKESLQLSPFFGLNPRTLPQDRACFNQYFQNMLSGGDLLRSPLSHTLSHSILNKNKILAPSVTSLAASSLPAEIRSGLALPWSAGTQARWSKIDRTIRGVNAVLPRPLRANPVALLARLKR